MTCKSKEKISMIKVDPSGQYLAFLVSADSDVCLDKNEKSVVHLDVL